MDHLRLQWLGGGFDCQIIRLMQLHCTPKSRCVWWHHARIHRIIMNENLGKLLYSATNEYSLSYSI